jgi:CDP-6-deoxy-D-xylo-4-hexulose-3-dehydrase
MGEIADRIKILKSVKEYCDLYHKPYETEHIHYAKKLYDCEEMVNLVDSSLDFWLTAGRYTDRFEKELAKFLGIKKCLFVNSGSSANLLAFMTLTSPLLGDRAIKRDDEVITVAVAFPTTVAPIVQFNTTAVVVDVTIPQYNINVDLLDTALTEKTKAVMLAHTMGNPFDLDAVKWFCDKNNLWLIEDNCDSLGSRYKYNGKWKYTGTLGDIGTSSFYPAHHITTGEGGAVYTDNPLLYKIALSLRDWGRDCSCPSGMDNNCGKRFNGQFGQLPIGYDHKYIYSHFGYNLKATDMQAAIGCAQLKKTGSILENILKE